MHLKRQIRLVEGTPQRVILLGLVGLIAFSSYATAQPTTLEAQLINASKAWSAAFLEGDGMAMDSLELSDVVVVVGGSIWSKSEPRAETLQSTKEVKSYSKEFETVRLLDDVGILTGYLTVLTNEKSTSVLSEVWTRQGGQWRAVAAHFSRQQPHSN